MPPIRRPTGRQLEWFASTLACLLVASCAERLEEPKPEAPDMAPLLAAYDGPNVELTEETAPEIIAATLERIPVLGVFCGWESLDDIGCDAEGHCAQCDGFDTVLAVLDELRSGDHGGQSGALTLAGRYATHRQALELGGTTFEGNGFMRVERICDGGEGTAPPDVDLNGLVDLTLGFTDAGIDPVIWGDFLSCRMALSGKPLLLDAALRLHWDAENGLDLAALDGLSALIALTGSLTFDGQALDVDLDLRALATGALEIRIPLDAERHVVFFASFEPTLGQMVQGYRAANGVFSCDFTNGTCSSL